ncbi:ABC transporter substrate-binding protein [Pseudoflavonifractor sp. 524-17]|uniref:ABC transporter substrate-binding protein n=1 Tax=Pseudoflavonifractor sp. 524-17 TaxID=2304577 RepID=UPI00137A8397|nr:ABC transporter substrate-binding protein [Pseudoflavonifractor sp. 524-17]
MKKLVALTLSLALAGALAACAPKQTQTPTPAGSDSPSGASPAPASQQPVVINYGISNPWDSLMPYNSPSGSNYSRMVYDKLYDRLAYVHADGALTPRGAVSWESADGGLAVLFHLDANAAFHDGTPVTAQHWADTIIRMTDPDCPTLGRSAFAVLAGTDGTGAAVEGETLGAQAVDELTLKLTFKAVTTPEDFLIDKNREYYVLPTHLMADTPAANTMEMDLWSAPVGSGPCRFESEVMGSTITLSANAGYQLGAPGFDRLVITVMDKSSLLTALIAGDLDYYAIGGSVAADSVSAASDAGLTVLEGTVPNTFYELMLNNETISDPRVRRAMELALDKELLAQQSVGSYGCVTGTSVLPDCASYAGDYNVSYDLEGAKALLEQAGYDGTTYRLACASNRAGLAALMQQQFQEAGIPITIDTVDSATMFSGMADGTYDMGIASHTPSALPLWFVESRFTEKNNIFHVQDLSAYETLIQAVKDAPDPTARQAAVQALEDYLAQERPFVPLWFGTALHVQSPTVSNIDYTSASFSNENVWEWVKQ